MPSELANVATLDRALIRGRAAVRQIGRAWQAVPQPNDLCAQLRDWRRDGYPRSAGRWARREVKRLFSTLRPGIIRRLTEAAERMIELGVPADQAGKFGSDEAGSW